MASMRDDREAARLYRLAQANKLIRLHPPVAANTVRWRKHRRNADMDDGLGSCRRGSLQEVNRE